MERPLIFMLYKCDTIGRKEKIRCVSSSIAKIADVIEDEIRKGNILYKSEDKEKSLGLFEIDYLTIAKDGCSDSIIAYEINSNMEFGHIRVLNDGELL